MKKLKHIGKFLIYSKATDNGAKVNLIMDMVDIV